MKMRWVQSLFVRTSKHPRTEYTFRFTSSNHSPFWTRLGSRLSLPAHGFAKFLGLLATCPRGRWRGKQSRGWRARSIPRQRASYRAMAPCLCPGRTTSMWRKHQPAPQRKGKGISTKGPRAKRTSQAGSLPHHGRRRPHLPTPTTQRQTRFNARPHEPAPRAACPLSRRRRAAVAAVPPHRCRHSRAAPRSGVPFPRSASRRLRQRAHAQPRSPLPRACAAPTRGETSLTRPRVHTPTRIRTCVYRVSRRPMRLFRVRRSAAHTRATQISSR